MTIGSFLLLIMLIAVTVWVVRAYRKVRRIYRMLFFGEMPQEKPRARNAGSRGRQTAPRRRGRKVINSDEGEYVDFEEIDAPEEPAAEFEYDTSRVYAEEQVSDAEWEEIKK